MRGPASAKALRLLLALLLWLPASCTLEDERDYCCERNTMRYRFLYRGEDRFGEHIRRMEYFLFDAEGRYEGRMYPQEGDLARVGLDSLPFGSYTLVAVGNLEDYGRLEGFADEGLAGFRLMLDDLRDQAGTLSNGDPLFWGSCRFTTAPGSDNTFLTEMAAIHSLLRLRVEWELLPEHPDGYLFRLEGIGTASDMGGEGALTIEGQRFPRHLGETGGMAVEVPLREMALEARLYTLRYTDERIPRFRLWHGQQPAGPEIDLGRAFRQWGWRPDMAPFQQWEVRVLIRADGAAEVTPGVGTDVDDWTDGGTIGF